jgi:hypothetical protein
MRALPANLGFGRIGVPEREAPNMLANLVYSGWAAVQSDNATEPSSHPAPEVFGDTSRAEARAVHAGVLDGLRHPEVRRGGPAPTLGYITDWKFVVLVAQIRTD